MKKWQKCFDCDQEFHGAVQLALGWACWKTYRGRPVTDGTQCQAMGALGGALRSSGRCAEAIPVLEAELALRRRHFSRSEQGILGTIANLANCHCDLGRDDEALALRREVYAGMVAVYGVSHERTILNGCNLGISLNNLALWDEALPLLRQLLPAARQLLGADNDVTLDIKLNLAHVLYNVPESSRDDLLEAETIMQGVVQRRRQVFGPAHPRTLLAERALSRARAKLARA